MVTLQDLKLQLQRIYLKGTVQLAEDIEDIITSLTNIKENIIKIEFYFI